MKKNYLLLLVSMLAFHFAISQTVDSLELRPGPDDGIDAEIRTDMDWPIWYEDDFIANAWTVQGMPFIQRTLLKFDLSAIPQGANIISAELALFCNTMTGHHQLHSGNNASYLLRITEPWNQHEVTWNTQPNTTFEDSVFLPQTTSQIQDYTNIDITEMIRYFQQHPDENYGFMMKLKEEIQLSCMVFSSSNHTDPAKRPLLKIIYSTCPLANPDFKYIKINNSSLVQFIQESSDDADYWWDFGNGFYSDKGSPLYLYPEPGNYQVCLTVSNACGDSTFCDSIQICDEIIGGSYTYQTEGNFASFTPVTFIEKVEYFWDFGDGFFSNQEKPIHYYKEPGKYHVCLYASNFCNQLINCDTISIGNKQSKINSSDVFVAYPNPSAGLVSIQHGGINSTFQKIRVVNFNGTQILNENHYRLRKDGMGYKCDFTGMETGIYTIQVITDIGVFIQKVVVVD